MIKTLLLAALVPEVPALKELTVSRLVQLNHGTIKSLIPGNEAGQAAQRIREWAASLHGELHVGTELDPTVALQLEGADLKPILQAYSGVDTQARRQRLVRDLIVGLTGLPLKGDAPEVVYDLEWRGTRRSGRVYFGNVRKIAENNPQALICARDDDFYVVIDYPFDDKGFGPNDDIRALDRLKEEGSPSWTLCWLPSFFSEEANRQLGQYAIVHHIVESADVLRQATQQLSVEQQQRAVIDLRNLKNAKEYYLRKVIEEAYGLARATDANIDPSLSIDYHLYLMTSDEQLRPGLAGNMEQAVEAYAAAVLETRYPRHPRFKKKITPQRTEAVLEVFGRLLDGGEKRLALSKESLEDVVGTLGELGIVRGSETAAILVEDGLLREIEQARLQKGENRPTVALVRKWADPDALMGLDAAAQNLLVRAYTRWASRTMVRFDVPYAPPRSGPIEADVELEKPDLPEPQAWEKALTLAGAAFGISFPNRAINADNLKRLEKELGAKVANVKDAAEALPPLLEARLQALGVPLDCDRLRTAQCAHELCAGLSQHSGFEQVNRLASFEAVTSPNAVGRSLKEAGAVHAALKNDLAFGALLMAESIPGGSLLLEQMRAALRQDEVVRGLAEDLQRLALAAQGLVQPLASKTATLLHEKRISPSRSAALQEVQSLLEKARSALSEAPSQGEFTVQLTLTVKEGPSG